MSNPTNRTISTPSLEDKIEDKKELPQNLSERVENAALRKRLAELETEVASLKQENADLKTKATDLTADRDKIGRERDIYYDVLMNIPGGVLIMLGENHIFTLTNPAYLQIANRTASIIGQPLSKVFPEIEEQGLFRAMDNVYNTGEPFIGHELPLMIDVTGNNDLREIYYDFIYVPIRDREGQIIGVLDFATDVTERVKARQMREHEQRRLQEIFDQAPASIAVLKGPNHTYELVNDLYMQLIGRRPHSIIGQTVAEVLPEVIEQGFINILDEVYRTNTPFLGKETLFLVDRKGTGEFEQAYVNFIYQPMLAQDGSGVESIFAHIVDITEQVEARRQVEELSRLKDEFLAIASHDLRTPVTSIKGFIQLLERNMQRELKANQEANQIGAAGQPQTQIQPGGQAKFFDTNLKIVATILNQTNRINELIARFLDYSRITQDQIRLQVTVNPDPAKLVSTVVANLEMTSPDHRIILEPIPDLSQVHLSYDEARLEQVLNNLVSNALKYSPTRTTVTVGIDAPERDATEVVMWVKDEGYGISPEEQTHLFERFYRIQNDQNASKGGLGLGLYISYQIIKQHGGRLWVESAVGKGSTFFVALPVF